MRLPIALSVLFLAAVIGVMATPLLPPINDPEILIDSDCCSTPFDITVVQPHSDCPVVSGVIQCDYDFVNTTGDVVTGFTFQTMINPGLSAAAAASFTCSDPKGFFLKCNASYSADGTLIYSFIGVNPTDDDETSEPEIGEQEGIPPGGHFKISLIGWSPDAMSAGQTLYIGLPSLHNTDTESPIPEPAAFLTLGTGLLILGAMLRRRRNR